LGPTIDPFFLVDDEGAADGNEATSPFAAEAPKTAGMVAIGVFSIIGIVLAAVAAVVVVLAILAGSGFFVAKRLLFEVESEVVTAEGAPVAELYNPAEHADINIPKVHGRVSISVPAGEVEMNPLSDATLPRLASAMQGV
jgi:hypothetical protein